MKDRLDTELYGSFRIGDCVDLYKATAALATTITEELKPITESSINATWQSVIEQEDSKFIIEQGGRILFGIPLLFQRYACFMSALGESLGELDDDMMGDDWVSESMPKTRAIATALMELTVNYLAEASVQMKEREGTTPAEVLVQSINTGESYEQSRARLSHAARGLQIVKSKDK